MTSVSEEAGRSLTAQQKSLAVAEDRQQLHSYQGSGRCRRDRDTRQVWFNWMHWAKETEDGGKERVQRSASVEVFTWCFHVCLPDCILGQGRHRARTARTLWWVKAASPSSEYFWCVIFSETHYKQGGQGGATQVTLYSLTCERFYIDFCGLVRESISLSTYFFSGFLPGCFEGHQDGTAFRLNSLHVLFYLITSCNL